MRIHVPTGKRLELMTWAGVNFDDFGTRSVHIDAAKQDNFTLDGNAIDQIHDLSGNNDIPIAAADWTLTPDVESGLNKITMGVNFVQTVGDWAAAPTQDSTIWFVATRRSNASTTTFGGSIYNSANRMQMHAPWSTGAFFFDHGDIGNGGRVTYADDGIVGETYVWMARHRWTVGDMVIRRGNRNKVYETHRSATAFNPTGEKFRLGRLYSEGIELKELLIYNTPVDDAQASFITRLLMNKWRVRNY